jgi:hypothetical protein
MKPTIHLHPVQRLKCKELHLRSPMRLHGLVLKGAQWQVYLLPFKCRVYAPSDFILHLLWKRSCIIVSWWRRLLRHQEKVTRYCFYHTSVFTLRWEIQTYFHRTFLPQGCLQKVWCTLIRRTDGLYYSNSLQHFNTIRVNVYSWHPTSGFGCIFSSLDSFKLYFSLILSGVKEPQQTFILLALYLF